MQSVIIYGELRARRVDPDQSAQPPSFALGSPLEKLNLLLQPQNRIDRVPPENLQGLGLQLLLGGSSVGGARSKLLTYDNVDAYIAKFPRQDDPFNMVPEIPLRESEQENHQKTLYV